MNKIRSFSKSRFLQPDVKRPLFKSTGRSHPLLTTMPVGKLVPFEWEEVLPGEIWHQKVPSFTRLSSTYQRPIMDDVYLDTFSFFVPLRLVQSNSESVFGNSSPSAYESPDLAEMVHIGSFGSADFRIKKYSVGDYLGLPCPPEDVVNPINLPTSFTLVPFRAFALCYDEFFRNQNVDQPMAVSLSSEPSVAEMNSFADNAPWSPSSYCGQLPDAPRYKDFFSSLLPGAQKGPAVKIPGLTMPVGTTNFDTIHYSADGPFSPLKMGTDGSGYDSTKAYPLKVDYFNGNTGLLVGNSTNAVGDSSASFAPVNLITIPSANAGTIDQLRLAFQLQKFLTRDALYGSRYREYLYAAYGVTSPDSRMQIPEFLCSSHTRLNVSQVVATSTSDDSTYDVGQVAAMSQTVSQKPQRFTKAFTEHGVIIHVACIRYKHLYSQGLERKWTRYKREQFFDPLFQNIGLQPVYTREIYADIQNSMANQVLGYTEAWMDYRVSFGRTSADARPYPGNLGAYWSLADVYTSVPSLLDVVHESSAPFERVVTDYNVQPFIVNFQFDTTIYTEVPPHSTPGLADHH